MKSHTSKINSTLIVQQGYDLIAEKYTAWVKSACSEERERYTDFLLKNVEIGSKVLELGCGSGDPTTIRFAERFVITGVDISQQQIRLARRNVPQATFIHGDMTQLNFPSASFNAVTAFYSITHVPRKQHANLIRKIADWLQPGGLFVASMSSRPSSDYIEDDWLGVPMFFSGYTVKTNQQIVKNAGLKILSAKLETEEEFGTPATFLWIAARKSGSDLLSSKPCKKT
jgi:ubiquinone/menaquinone biosynthesis C-methylase UbiE